MPEPKSKKLPKGSVLEEEERLEPIPYDEEEKVYISNLQKRLTSAKLMRSQSFIEFDGLTYEEYWRANEHGANTVLEMRKNRADTMFQTGTLRQKMFSLLATYQGLNLKSSITAFTEQEVVIKSLGDAMEDIIEKVGELENDEEWRMMRQYEMLKHGTVFVEDIWDERWEIHKVVTSGFYGQKSGMKWTSERVRVTAAPRRSIISGLSVFLGDLTKYLGEDQPYLFTIQVINWEDAKGLYGEWEMWKHVSKTKRSFGGAADMQMINNAWRLGDIKQGQVEVIKYQDKPNNEFQIILNGVPMLPLGFPLSEVSPSGDYTIIQQNLEPIRHNFSYGKSFIFKNKNMVAVLDQMMRLAVLKTQKSFMPPYLNLSSRVISKDIFLPGHISRGIQRNEITPLSDKESEGVTNSEFNMIQEIIRSIDKSTVSQTFAGQREAKGQVTATQIIELQRQARIMMGILNLSASLLEKKLDTKRLIILLANWFEPTGKAFNKARTELRNRYRIVSRERTISGKGDGIRMVIPTDKAPSKIQVRKIQDRLKEKYGKPVKIIVLNRSELKKAKMTWIVIVNPREKRSSEYSKLLFDEMLSRAIKLGLNLNPEYVQERFAEVWEEDSSKMFGGKAPMPAMPEAPGRAPKAVSPEVRMPGEAAVAK